jgi:hypothetical protein
MTKFLGSSLVAVQPSLIDVMEQRLRAVRLAKHAFAELAGITVAN